MHGVTRGPSGIIVPLLLWGGPLLILLKLLLPFGAMPPTLLLELGEDAMEEQDVETEMDSGMGTQNNPPVGMVSIEFGGKPLLLLLLLFCFLRRFALGPAAATAAIAGSFTPGGGESSLVRSTTGRLLLFLLFAGDDAALLLLFGLGTAHVVAVLLLLVRMPLAMCNGPEAAAADEDKDAPMQNTIEDDDLLPSST